jgi:hypothetical protein
MKLQELLREAQNFTSMTTKQIEQMVYKAIHDEQPNWNARADIKNDNPDYGHVDTVTFEVDANKSYSPQTLTKILAPFFGPMRSQGLTFTQPKAAEGKQNVVTFTIGLPKK